MVAADVTRAQARLQSAAARVLQADRALRTAIITFNGTFEGLRQTTRLRRRPGRWSTALRKRSTHSSS